MKWDMEASSLDMRVPRMHPRDTMWSAPVPLGWWSVFTGTPPSELAQELLEKARRAFPATPIIGLFIYSTQWFNSNKILEATILDVLE